MDRGYRILPILTAATGLAWMAAVLLIAANPKGIDLAGDLAYDRANRLHTVALVFLLATGIVMYRTIRTGGLAGRRAAKVLVAGAALMLAGNTVSFWGALVVDEQSEQFWGGLAGWLTYLPGEVLLLGAFIALARAARQWPVSSAQRWSTGLVGVFLALTTATWAISPAVTLAPAVLAAFALLAAGTTVTHAADAGHPPVTAPANHEQGIRPAS